MARPRTWSLNGGRPADPVWAAEEVMTAWKSGSTLALGQVYDHLTLCAYDPRTGRAVGPPIRVDDRTSVTSLGVTLDRLGRQGQPRQRNPATGRMEQPFRDLVFRVVRFHVSPKARS